MSPQPPPKEGKDHIYNGANDDGSGTVSVIEIAKALSRLKVRPRRSIVFVTFFGEERGDIGSGYYGRHPVFPMGKTIADVNLEQVGRTDSTAGKQISNATLTGYDYSDVTKFLAEAGRRMALRSISTKKGATLTSSEVTTRRSLSRAFRRTPYALPLIIRTTMPWKTNGKRSTTTTWPKWIVPWRSGCSTLQIAHGLRNGTRVLQRPEPIARLRPRRSPQLDSAAAGLFSIGKPRGLA